MPTTRRRRSRTVATLRRRDLPGHEQLDMICGWRPPRSGSGAGRSRWQTYREYLDTYRQVREEFRADWTRAFAEHLHKRVQRFGIAHVERLGAELYAAWWGRQDAGA